MIGFPGLSPGEYDPKRIVAMLMRLLAGKLNAVTTVTLTAGATSTTLTDTRIGGESWIGLSPRSATAVAAPVYIGTKDTGSVVLTHDSTADTDRTFDVLIIG